MNIVVGLVATLSLLCAFAQETPEAPAQFPGGGPGFPGRFPGGGPGFPGGRPGFPGTGGIPIRCQICPRPICRCNWRFGQRCIYVPRTCFRCDYYACIRTGSQMGRFQMEPEAPMEPLSPDFPFDDDGNFAPGMFFDDGSRDEL